MVKVVTALIAFLAVVSWVALRHVPVGMRSTFDEKPAGHARFLLIERPHYLVPREIHVIADGNLFVVWPWFDDPWFVGSPIAAFAIPEGDGTESLGRAQVIVVNQWADDPELRQRVLAIEMGGDVYEYADEFAAVWPSDGPALWGASAAVLVFLDYRLAPGSEGWGLLAVDRPLGGGKVRRVDPNEAIQLVWGGDVVKAAAELCARFRGAKWDGGRGVECP